MNEIAQWSALALVGVMVLGLYVQLARLMGLASRPELRQQAGPQLGKKLDGGTLRKLRADARSRNFFAFVAEGCGGCQELLGRLEATATRDVTVVAIGGSQQFMAALARTGLPVIDDDGALEAKLNVVATPLIVVIDDEGRVVGKDVGHDVGALREQLGSATPRPQAPVR